MENEKTKITLGEGPADENANIPEEFKKKDFEILTDTMDLPSKGVFYPNGQKTVKYKYLTADEDDVLFSPELLKSGKVLDALLQIAVVDEDDEPLGAGGYLQSPSPITIVFVLLS